MRNAIYFPFLLALALAAGLCGSACSSHTRAVAFARALINAAGGSVTSSDGKVKITIPAGALGAETEISIRRVEGSELPPELVAEGVTHAYELLPDGLVFALPVEVAFALDGPPRQANGDLVAPLLSALLFSGGVLEELEDARTVVDEDANTAVVLAEIGHFSTIATRLDGGSASIKQIAVPGELAFDLQITVDRGTSTRLQGIVYEDKTPTGSLFFDEQENEPILFGTGQNTATGTIRRYQCGSRTTGSRLAGQPRSLDSYEQLVRAFLFLAHFDHERATSAVAQAGPPTRTPTWVGQLQLVRVPGNVVTRFHRVEVRGYFVCQNLPPVEGDREIVAVAGSNGFAIIDVDTGEELLPPEPSDGPFYGAVPFFAGGIPGFLLHGPNGYEVQHYDPVTLARGTRGFVFGFPSVTDVFPVGKNSPDHFVLSGNGTGRILFFGPHQDGGLTTTHNELAKSAYAAATGNVVSAIQKTRDGPVLFVTDGTPGEVWKLADPSIAFPRTVSRVAFVGNSPRRIRYCGDIAFVTNFGDRTLTLLRWSDTVCALLATVEVGDSPIGADGTLLPDGNIAVVTTGFNDHTYWITVIRSSDGAVLTNRGFPVPDGCLNPGFAIWLADGSIAISCNGSDRVVRVIPDLS